MVDVLYFYYSILGHEGVVEVVEHACDDSDLNAGDRLTFTVADFCQNCERCHNDLHQKCHDLFKVSMHWTHEFPIKFASMWQACFCSAKVSSRSVGF